MVVNNINDIVSGKGLERADQLSHYAFKHTDCGAWIKWDDTSVTIGSIVEGSNAEFEETFYFPVDSDELDRWVEELERLCDEAWHEANDCEDEEENEK